MDSTTFIERCHAYFDHRLSPEEAAHFEHWIQNHPERRALFDQLRHVHQSLRTYAPIDPPARLESRIQQAVAAERETVAPIHAGASPWRRPLQAVAAVMFVGLVLAAMLPMLSPKTEAPHPPELTASQDGERATEPELMPPSDLELLASSQTVASDKGAVHSPPSPNENGPRTNSDAALESAMVAAWNGLDEMEHQVAMLENATAWVQPPIDSEWY